MLLIYTPDGGDRQEFSFRPGKLLSVEAEAIEDVGGNSWETFEQFGRKFMAGSAKAYRAALWVMLKRQDPKLRFVDLALTMEELDVDYEPDELERLRAAIENDEDLTADQKAELLAPLSPGKSATGDDSTDST